MRWLIAALLVAGVNCKRGTQTDDRAKIAPVVSKDDSRLGPWLQATWQGKNGGDIPVSLSGPNQGIFVTVRDGGLRVVDEWFADPGTRAEAFRAGLKRLKERMGKSADQADRLVYCVAHDFRNVATGKGASARLSNVHRGVRGVEIKSPHTARRFSPIEMLTRNLSFDKALKEAQSRLGAQTPANELLIRDFACDQGLVDLSNGELRQLIRGNELVPMSAVTQESVKETLRLMGNWMYANLDEGGRMLYKYWPSRGKAADSNNMIRQWMATMALIRVAKRRGDDALMARAKENIRYNLKAFYKEEEGLGLIYFRGKVKLGAVALAALAIHSHPDRQEFAKEEAALRAMTVRLHRESGEFQTLYRPIDPRNPFQNFYTGEALLYWAHLIAEGDTELLPRYLKSFRYYRDWHLQPKIRNPAFVPWHTQANYLVWKKTKNEELKDFIFVMNDWLLGVQEWEGAVYPDVQGRFYDRKRSHFGPPHASSTGVYLEGLADAYALAVETGDEERAAKYLRAIRRGVRSVMQLQFVDDVDMFYVSKRKRVLGGIRTRVYHNEIRVDNIQHNLLGIDKLLAVVPATAWTEPTK